MDAVGDVVGQVHDLAFHGFAGFGSSCLQPAEHVLVIRVHAELHATATVVLGRFGEGPRVFDGRVQRSLVRFTPADRPSEWKTFGSSRVSRRSVCALPSNPPMSAAMSASARSPL